MNVSQSQDALPLKIEEDLAEAVGCVLRGGILSNYTFSEILGRIAFEMRLQSHMRKIVADPIWLKVFMRRWNHKFTGERAAERLEEMEVSVQQNRLNTNGGGQLIKPSFVVLQRVTDNGTSQGVDDVMLPYHRARRIKSCALPDRSHNDRLRKRTEVHYSNSHKRKKEMRNQLNHILDTVKRKALGLRERVKPVTHFHLDHQVTERIRPPESSDSDESYIDTTSIDDSDSSSSLQTSGSVRAKRMIKLDEKQEVTSVSGREIKRPQRFQSNQVLRLRRKKHKSGTKVENNKVSCSEEESSDSSDEGSASNRNSAMMHTVADGGRKNFELVLAGLMDIGDLCLACGSNENIHAKHPLFIGGLCNEHKELLHEWFFKYDDDGYHSCCSVCCMGKKVVLCDIQDCGRCYCKTCLDTLIGHGCFSDAVNSEHWTCHFCDTSREGLLKKRCEWQEEIQRLYQVTGDSKYQMFPVPAPIPVQQRRPLRVLSLFDGIATGVVALKQLGLEIGQFVASEIDEDAIRLVQNKHPEVIHIGDITKITDDDIFMMGPFDLLLGGSPCNDLSGANPRRRGLIDAEGSGCLFFDFYRILRTIEPPRSTNGEPRRPFFWLFENVVSMKGVEKERITRFLQCEPKMVDARCVSAAARPRLFWGNLPGLKDRKITPGVKDRLTVQDCLESNRKAQVQKLNTITTKYTCLYQGVTRQAPVLHNDKDDVLWTTELERVFGVPEHYTDVNNLGPRERLALLGRSWSVPVVRLLLAPLKEYFSGVQQMPEEQKCTSGMWWS